MSVFTEELVKALQSELAAERDYSERAEANMRVFIDKEHTPIVEQLRSQLAAAVKALERIASFDNVEGNIASHALAAVKRAERHNEGKK